MTIRVLLINTWWSRALSRYSYSRLQQGVRNICTDISLTDAMPLEGAFHKFEHLDEVSMTSWKAIYLSQ